MLDGVGPKDEIVFVARSEEQDRFRHLLTQVRDGKDDVGEGRVVLVYGHGGIGKSRLLSRFGEIAEGSLDATEISPGKFAVIDVDWERDRRLNSADYDSHAGPAIWTVLARLEARIREVFGEKTADKPFRGFRKQLKDFPHVQRLAEAVGLADELGGARPTAADLTRRGVEVAEAGAGLLGGPAQSVAKAAGAASSAAVDLVSALRGRRVSQAEIDRIFAPVDAMVREFADGLRQVARQRPAVLLLDTCELIGEAGARLREVMRRAGPRVVWVLGARMEHDTDSSSDSEARAFRREISHERLVAMPLSTFDDASIAAYLRLKLGGPAADGQLVERVAQHSRGVPLAVSFLARMLSGGEPVDEILPPVGAEPDSSALIRHLAERYLIHVRKIPDLEGDELALCGLALYQENSIGTGVLAALWNVPEDGVDAVMTVLSQRHDFVLSGRRRLHHEFRLTLLAYLKDPLRRAAVRPMNDRAAAYLRSRAQTVPAVEEQLESQDWQETVAAVLWHTMWSDPERALALLRHLYPYAMVLDPAFAQRLVLVVDEFDGILSDEQRRRHADLTMATTGSWYSSPSTLRKVLRWCETATLDDPVVASDIPREVYIHLLQCRLEEREDRDATALDRRVKALAAAALNLPERSERTKEAIADAAAQMCRELIVPSALRREPSSVALRAAQLAVQLNDDDADNLRYLGLARLAMGEERAARDLFERVYAVDSGERQWTMLSLAHDISNIGHPRIAVDYYQRAAQLDPDDAKCWNYLGVCQDQTGDTHAAADSYARAASLDGDLAVAHYNLGLSRRNVGDSTWREALLEAERQLRGQLDAPAFGIAGENRRLLGDTLGYLCRWDEAIEHYRDAIDAGAAGEVHAGLADALLATGRYDQAIAAYAQALDSGHETDWLRRSLGDALAGVGRIRQARREWERSRRELQDELLSRGEQWITWYTLGGVEMRLHRFAEAVEAYEKAVELRPD
ncbi:MAG: tetratricopeptide repeat protein, partial [Stackebrandtia sp.]